MLYEVITFFLSIELEKNLHQYYALLNNLRSDKPKWKAWIEFFINAAERQADTAIDKLQRAEKLFEDINKLAKEKGIRPDIVNVIFSDPIS